MPISPILSQRKAHTSSRPSQTRQNGKISPKISSFSSSPNSTRKSVAVLDQSNVIDCVPSTPPLTPSSIRKLRQHRIPEAISSPFVTASSSANISYQQESISPMTFILTARSDSATRGATTATASATSAESRYGAQNPLTRTAPLPRVFQQIGATMPIVAHTALETAQLMSSTALDAAVSMGSVLGTRAEHMVAHASQNILPVYTQHDMAEVVNKKYDLLNELSRSVVLLGEMEAKQKLFSDKISAYDTTIQRLGQLESELLQVCADRDKLCFRLEHAETSIHVLTQEQHSDAVTIDKLHGEIASLKQGNAELVKQGAEASAVHDGVYAKYQELLLLHAKVTEQHALDLQVIQEQLQKSQQHVEELRANRDNLQITSQAQLELQQERQQQSQKAIESLQEQLESQQADIEHIRTLLQQCEDERDKTSGKYHLLLQEQQEKHYAEMLAKEEKVQALENDKLDLKNTVSIQKHTVSALELECKEYRDQFKKLQGDYAACQVDKDSSQQMVVQLQTLLADIESSNRTLQKQLEGKEVNLINIQNELVTVQQSLKISSLSIQAYEAEMTVWKEDIQGMQKLINDHKQAMTSYKHALQGFYVSFQRVKSDYLACKQELPSAMSVYSSQVNILVPTLLQPYQQHRQQLEAVNKSQKDAITALELSYATLQHACECWKEQLASEHSHLEHIQSDSNIAKANYLQQLESMQSKIQHLQHVIDTLQAEKREVVIQHAMELQSVHTQHIQCQSETKELRQLASQLHQNLDELRGEVARKDGEKAAVQAQYDALHVMYEAETSQHNLSVSEHNTQLLHLSGNIDELNGTIITLKQELSAKEGSFISSLAYVEQTHKALTGKLYERIAELEGTLEQVTQLRIVQEAELAKSDAVLNQQSHRVHDLSAQVSTQLSTISGLQLQLQEAKQINIQQTAQYQQAKEVLQEMEETYEQKISNLQVISANRLLLRPDI